MSSLFTFYPPLPKIAGNPGLIAQAPELTWDSKDGYQLVNRFKGLTQTILQVMAQNRGLGVKMRAIPEQDSPYSVLEISYPSALDGSDPNNDYQILWFFDGNMLEKDIYTCPAFQALNHADQAAVQLGQSKIADGTYSLASYIAYDADQSAATIPPEPPMSAQAITILTAIVNGTTSYMIPQVVLRRTTIINPLANRQFMTYVGQLYTADQLIAIENPDPVIQSDMPGGYYFKIAPKKEQQSNGKWVVNEEWWNVDGALSFLYLNITPPS